MSICNQVNCNSMNILNLKKKYKEIQKKTGNNGKDGTIDNKITVVRMTNQYTSQVGDEIEQIIYDTVDIDDLNLFDNITNAITINRAGWYRVSLYIDIEVDEQHCNVFLLNNDLITLIDRVINVHSYDGAGSRLVPGNYSKLINFSIGDSFKVAFNASQGSTIVNSQLSIEFVK